MRALPILLAALGFGCLACAGGGQLETGFTPEGNGGASATSGGGNGGDTMSSSRASIGHTTGVGHTTGIGPGPATTGIGPASSVVASSTGAGVVCDYTSPNSCNSALALTDIDGDQNADTRIEHGSTSEWFSIYVNDATNFASNESFTATLVPPPGADFELYLYEGDGNGVNCSGTMFQATGSPPSLTLQWPDGLGDDSYYFSIEVRYVSGTGSSCTDPWTLTVQGNTDP